MRIGDAAELIGVAAHTLRHWEEVGVLLPDRSSSGHRVYTAETIARARLVLVCQRAGLSLAEIGLLADLQTPGRAALIATHRGRIRRERQILQRTDRFLAHVLECRHPLITQCPQCSAFALPPDSRELSLPARSDSFQRS